MTGCFRHQVGYVWAYCHSQQRCVLFRSSFYTITLGFDVLSSSQGQLRGFHVIFALQVTPSRFPMRLPPDNRYQRSAGTVGKSNSEQHLSNLTCSGLSPPRISTWQLLVLIPLGYKSLYGGDCRGVGARTSKFEQLTSGNAGNGTGIYITNCTMFNELIRDLLTCSIGSS